TAGQRGPAGAGEAGGVGGVEDLDGALLRSPGEGVGDEVVLGGGGDDRSGPFEDGGDGEPGGLAGLGGAEHEEAVAGLDGELGVVEGADDEAAVVVAVDAEAANVVQGGPLGAGVDRSTSSVPGQEGAAGQ